MIIYYRLSDGSYPKVRFEKATKEKCLDNFLWHFANINDTFNLYLDNVKDETFEYYQTLASGRKEISFALMPFNIVRSSGGSSAAGFRIVFNEALKLGDDEVVYFVEDDYIHLPGSRKVLMEGLERSHYVTLYNHPDKYIPASEGGNPLIGEDASETTKVFVTDNSYWMATNSTTMTFATRVRFLKEDMDVWQKYTEGSYPHDMKIFLELREKGRSLIQPIPTKSTHGEPQWAAHLHGTGITDWYEVL